jgi:hypothetical protein
MYIPTTFFGAQAAYIIASGSKSSGLNYYTGIYFSGSQPWEYHYWGGDNNDAESTSTTSGSLVIFSGSTQEANVYVIAGGGGSGNVHDIYPNGIGGGGAGGVVRYNNFQLYPGTYNIVAGGGGDLRPLGAPPGPFTPGTPPYATAGFPGVNSYIQLPNSGTYTPFTSSFIIAYGGSGGGAASGNAVYQAYVTASNSIPGGSNGGNAQTYSTNGANTPTSSLGIGLGGLNGLNQGNLGGGVGASSNISHLAGCSAGGGGAMSRSLDITPIPNSPYYSAATTNGGDGIQLKIYPLDNGTASYYAGGGNATNCITRTSSSYGLGGGRDIVGSGGGNLCTPVGEDFAAVSYIGNAGGVYIEYPLIQPLSPSTMIYDGLTSWQSFTSISGSVWYDLSGNFNQALISGSTLNVTNNMVNFNGIDNYVTFPVTMTATPSSSMTLIWYGVYNSSSVNYDLFTKNYYADGWDTVFEPTRITFRDNGDANLINNYTYGNKTLYALTVTNGSQQLYKDWIEISNSNKQFDGFTASASPLKFGWNADTDATYFSGSISDILVYNRILTQSEIISINNYLSQNFSRPSIPLPPVPPTEISVDYLVVGAGGGGGTLSLSNTGSKAAGGGGGGQVLSGSITLSKATGSVSYSVVVAPSSSTSTNGATSSFYSFSALGGGAGAAPNSTYTGSNGANGGGGGAWANKQNLLFANGGTGSNSFNGGNSTVYNGPGVNDYYAWGGGGAGAAERGFDGGVINPNPGANGGSGSIWLNGSYYGAGGGGGLAGISGISTSGAAGLGGFGGGGNGARAHRNNFANPATNPTPNKGGGGGGGAYNATGSLQSTNGASGVVVIRYSGSGSQAQGGTISYSGGYTYHTFTSSAAFIY